MARRILFVVLSLLICKMSHAQEDEFMHPGVRSSQTPKGHLEMEVNGSYGKFYRNSSSDRYAGLSPSIFYGLFKRLNIGVVYQYLYIEEKSTDFSTTFTSKYSSNSLGPQIRIKLSGKGRKSEIYIQSGAMIPLDSYNSPDKITYSAHLISSFRIGYHWISSAQFSGILFPSYPEQLRPFNLNASLFAGYLVKNNLMPFALVNHSSDFGGIKSESNNSYNRLNYSTNLGAGLKYHIFRHIELSGFYFRTVHSKNGNLFNTLSLGIVVRF
jgi:hypothetical protein